MVESLATDPRPTPERILDAALAAFADRGVEATSLDSLAVEIGVRKQTILYWFPSKEQLLLGVVDHAVAQLGARLSEAAVAAGPVLADQVVAVVDVTFRLGRTHPELLAVVREVSRVGPPASTHLARAVEPLVSTAARALAVDVDADEGAHVEVDRLARVLLGAGARVVGMATEAEVLTDLGQAPDLAWLRARRRALIASLVAELT
jgi:AcrR family transcriptional regulator